MGRFQKLDDLLQHFVGRGPAGCACRVVHRGETVYEGYVGYADLESRKPIEADTIYRIYSMTKPVTCTAALMLYEQGKFLLNDPLHEYLPEFRNPQVYRRAEDGTWYTSPAARPILVKDLFTMSSGLTYGGDGDETERQTAKVMAELNRLQEGAKYNVRTLAQRLAEIPLAFDPGSRWRYSLSHDVLGALIEEVSGQSFGDFLQEHLFAPLGMKDTFFRIPDEKRGRLCRLYNRSEDGTLTPNTDMDAPFQPDARFESGGGGLLSTIGDYIRFAQMLARGGTVDGVRILGRNTVRLMATNHLNAKQMEDFDWPYQAGYGYGLGVRVMVDPVAGGSNGSIGEFGWCGLAGTWVLIDPAVDLTAVYMQQMMPNFEAYHQPRLRNVIYGAL